MLLNFSSFFLVIFYFFFVLLRRHLADVRCACNVRARKPTKNIKNIFKLHERAMAKEDKKVKKNKKYQTKLKQQGKDS